MTTFAALGDSITLGIGDPAPGRAWRGWAALLAEGLPEARLHNLATAGAQAADVERDQLPRALELRTPAGLCLAWARPPGRHLTT